MMLVCDRCGKTSDSKRWIRYYWEECSIRCPECGNFIKLDGLFTNRHDENAQYVLMNTFPYNIHHLEEKVNE